MDIWGLVTAVGTSLGLPYDGGNDSETSGPLVFRE